MHIRFLATLLMILSVVACTSAPRLPDLPDLAGSSYRGPGAAYVKHEALAPDEHEAGQPLMVTISRVGREPTESGIELVLRPGEAEVVRLRPGRYEYVVTGRLKRPLRESFEIAAPLRLFFDLTLSLRRPVRQAYLSNADQMKRERTLHHPTATVTILSDARRTVEVTAQTPKGDRFRAPAPLPPCPPLESDKFAVVAPEESIENLGMNLIGSLMGGAPPVEAAPPASLEREPGVCFDEDRDPEWQEWMDRYTVSEVMDGVLPHSPLDIDGVFSISLGVPANLNLPAGQWLLSGDGREVRIDIEATTRIVIVEWDLSPPKVHLIPLAQ